MPTPARGYSDSPRVTVAELMKDPLTIPALILDMTRNEFIVDSVLRPGGSAPSGAVRFAESTPLYADDFPEIRAEFAEVPIVPTSVGIPRVVFAHERAMAIMVSDEMRRRQSVDPVTRQLMQVKNTMTYSWNTAFYSAVVANANIQTLAVANTWASAGATIRADLAQASFLVENAATTAPSGMTQWLGFEADTLIINHGTKNTLLQSNTFAAPYVGDIASENLLYTGTLPQKILTLDVMVSRQVPAGNAIVMQRNRCGLYPDEPRKTFRSDTQRAAALGLDQPLAIVLLSGV